MQAVVILLSLASLLCIGVLALGTYYSGKAGISKDECPAPNESSKSSNSAIGLSLTILALISIVGIIMYMIVKKIITFQ